MRTTLTPRLVFRFKAEANGPPARGRGRSEAEAENRSLKPEQKAEAQGGERTGETPFFYDVGGYIKKL